MENKSEKEPQMQLTELKDGSKDMEANPSNAEPKVWKNSSFLERIGIIRRYITVEPMLACYIMPSVIASIAVQNLNLEKACRVNQNYSTELCDDIITQRLNGSMEEVEVQKLVAYMGAWRLPLQTAIPAIMILFIGPWSDRTGKRKPCMLVPILGEFLTAVGLIFCTYYFLQWPLEVAGVIEALPPAITGGYATMFLGIFTYLADNTTPEERTFRIGVVNTFISLALPVGMALSGTLLNAIGFYGVFTISIAFYGAAFLYGYFGIHDKKAIKEVDTNHHIELSSCAEFFSLVHVWDTFMVIFKKRITNRRLQTILLVVCYILVSGPVHGAGSVQYYYARRAYQFNEVDFSIFSSYTIIVNFFGVMFALSVLSKYFQMNDCLLAAIACFSKVMASFVYAFAPTKEWMYLGPIVELMGGTAVIAMRSMATKVVDNNEVGKINSVFGVCEALVNTIYGPIFATFYASTVESFPGAFCILSAFLLAPSVAIFLYMYKLQKVDNFNGEEEKEAKDNPGFEREMSHL